jgi:DNA-binding transcriptional ArsR family regulator
MCRSSRLENPRLSALFALTFKRNLNIHPRVSRPPSKDVFRAIADPTRRGLLDGLRRGETAMGELASEFDLSLAAVSQHLKVLRDVGLVTEQRVGRQRLYRIRPAPLREVTRWVAHFEHFWNDKLDALGRHLKERP